jgi:gentisate 1,2-dioxygenase
VSAIEQREGIGKVLQLANVGNPNGTTCTSGMHCGMQAVQTVLIASGTNTGCV